MILTIRTDKPEAEVGLFDSGQKLAYEKWQAHRQLSETIHKKISELLKEQKADWSNIKGIIAYSGPGSFTGLRIGASVANSLAESLEIPVIGSTGDDWIKQGIEKLKRGENNKIIVPEYGRGARITQPRK